MRLLFTSIQQLRISITCFHFSFVTCISFKKFSLIQEVIFYFRQPLQTTCNITLKETVFRKIGFCSNNTHDKMISIKQMKISQSEKVMKKSDWIEKTSKPTTPNARLDFCSFLPNQYAKLQNHTGWRFNKEKSMMTMVLVKLTLSLNGLWVHTWKESNIGVKGKPSFIIYSWQLAHQQLIYSTYTFFALHVQKITYIISFCHSHT